MSAVTSLKVLDITLEPAIAMLQRHFWILLRPLPRTSACQPSPAAFAWRTKQEEADEGSAGSLASKKNMQEAWIQSTKVANAAAHVPRTLIERRSRAMLRLRAEHSLDLLSSLQSEVEHHDGLGARRFTDDGSWSEKRGKLLIQHCTLPRTRDGRTNVQCLLKTRCTLEMDAGAFIEGDGASRPARLTRVQYLWQVCCGKRGGCVLVEHDQLQSTYKIRTHTLQSQYRHGL